MCIINQGETELVHHMVSRHSQEKHTQEASVYSLQISVDWFISIYRFVGRFSSQTHHRAVRQTDRQMKFNMKLLQMSWNTRTPLAHISGSCFESNMQEVLCCKRLQVNSDWPSTTKQLRVKTKQVKRIVWAETSLSSVVDLHFSSRSVLLASNVCTDCNCLFSLHDTV